MTSLKACQECGGPLSPSTGRGSPKRYCSIACRDAAAKRRTLRGRELYELRHAWRDGAGKKKGSFTQLSRMLDNYRRADKVLRDGRPSWEADEASQKLPLAYGKSGDNR